jgi:hypothetical protein
MENLVKWKPTIGNDWWGEISLIEKEEIEEGLAQADSGEVLPHKEVMAKYENWL